MLSGLGGKIFWELKKKSSGGKRKEEKGFRRSLGRKF